MTVHFRHSLRIIGIALVLLLGLFVWFKRQVDRLVVLPPISRGKGLAKDERELIAFNEKTHRLIITTPSSTVKLYARNPTVRVKKDGRILIDRHLFDFELRPFVGVGYSDTTRAFVGIEPFYWGAFDASISAGISLDRRYTFARPYAAFGYNCWGNLSMNAGINPLAVKQLDTVLFMSL